jgi:23S rRNA pseudouridine955/2504/2580 synthase
MADLKHDIRKVKPADAGARLDRWLKANYPALPHSLVQKLLRTGDIRVDGVKAKADLRLDAGQQVAVRRAVLEASPERDVERTSLAVPLGLSKADRTFIENMIIYEDDELMVLNKPFGVAVQGGTKTKRHIDGLLAGMEDRFGGRPRLVHRLDRDTSGVLLVAKTRAAAARYGKLFQTRSVQKIYWALVKGIPRPPQGEARRAGSGAIGDHPLFGHRKGRAENGVAVAEAGHRPPAPAPRPYGDHRPPDRRRPEI